MHVKSAPIARGGIFTALSVICILLASFFSFSTFFFLVIAGCFTAFAYSFSSARFGLAALVAGAVLGFIFSPEKGIIFTYIGISAYLILAQVIERHFFEKGPFVYWGLKCLVFNALFWGLFFIAYLAFGAAGLFSEDLIEHFSSFSAKWLIIIGFVVAAEAGFVMVDRLFFLLRNRLGPIIMGE